MCFCHSKFVKKKNKDRDHRIKSYESQLELNNLIQCLHPDGVCSLANLMSGSSVLKLLVVFIL